VLIPLESITVFVAAAIALSLAPGPDNLFVIIQSALYGPRAGILVTLGLCTGLLFHTTAVTLGVATIFQSSELAFKLLKTVGAIYLMYLAWQAFRAGATIVEGTRAPELNLGSLYGRGIIMNVTNPKVALFFLAFLPQFADPKHGSVTTQLLVYGALFIAVAFLVFGTIAVTSGTLGEWLKRSAKVQIIMNRVAGAVLLGLALTLIASGR
jgi:threonine/homoserine/homoserine lactone efflux protein